jgi:hypothetical protein
MYPDELDCLYGDPILLKVDKRYLNDDINSKECKIVDFLNDPFILDHFFKFYMPSYGTFDGVAVKQSPLQIYDAFSSTDCQSFIEVSPNYKLKTEFERFPNLIGLIDTATSSQGKTQCKLNPNSAGSSTDGLVATTNCRII